MGDETEEGSVINGTDISIAPSGPIRDEDTITILIATDNHLGYSDMNPAREDDSFNTFEEILEIAAEQNVDFVLLGGDLFHENKPKPSTFQRSIGILRKHVLGSKPVHFEYLGDPTQDFGATSSTPEINYYNQNMNIGLPIFSIHGNHDDPIGGKRTSVIDHLAAANLINHFGQWTGLHGFDVRPVCLRKGSTNLAMYGLGHMKDERLYRLMRDNKVSFLRPQEETENWFNLFVLHQNRAKHGQKNFFEQGFLPEFLDYIVWGHEHESRPKEDLVEGRDKRMFIIQPGSSVATSLSEGEAAPKHVVLLKINGRNFCNKFIPLKTVRPFKFSEISIPDILNEYKAGSKSSKFRDTSKYIESYVESHIKNMIEEALMEQLTGDPKQPTEPLLRLRIIYENDNEKFDTVKFGQQFAGQIANDDFILFKKKGTKTDPDDVALMSIGAIRDMINSLDDQNMVDLGAHVEEIVERHFANEKIRNGQILEILSDKGLSEAVRCCVDKDDKESVSLIIDAQIKTVTEHLARRKVTAETIEDEIVEFRNLRSTQVDQDIQQARNVLAGRKNNKKAPAAEESDDDEPAIEEDDDDDEVSPSTSRGGRGAGARGGRGRGSRARGGAAAASNRGRGGRGSRARGANGNTGGSRGRGVIQTTIPILRESPRRTAGRSNIQFDDSD